MNEDTQVVAILERLRPMLMELARNYRLDFNDVQQDAAVIILETLPKMDCTYNTIPYLRVAVRRQIAMRVHAELATVSLDLPVTEDGLTLEDMLPAAPPDHNHTREDKLTRAMHQALRRLPNNEQVYMSRVHKLAAFKPRRRITEARDVHSIRMVSKRAYRHLRTDQQLAQAALC